MPGPGIALSPAGTASSIQPRSLTHLPAALATQLARRRMAALARTGLWSVRAAASRRCAPAAARPCVFAPARLVAQP